MLCFDVYLTHLREVLTTPTSKKNSLKKFVAKPIRLRRMVGKKTVRKVPNNLLPKVNETTTAVMS